MRRWVGGTQVHALAALHQPQRQRCRHRGLADAALAHHHDQALAGLRQCIGQSGQPLAGQRAGARRHRARSARCRPTPQQGAQRSQPHRVKGPQRHLVRRQGAQGVGHGLQRLLAQRLQRTGHGIARVGGVEHTVHHQPLVGQAQRFEFVAGPGRLLDGAGVWPRHQHHGGQGRVAQGVQRALKAHLLHFQA